MKLKYVFALGPSLGIPAQALLRLSPCSRSTAAMLDRSPYHPKRAFSSSWSEPSLHDGNHVARCCLAHNSSSFSHASSSAVSATIFVHSSGGSGSTLLLDAFVEGVPVATTGSRARHGSGMPAGAAP